MPGDSTKERIMEVSLKLFSRHGFHAVSIRDICKEVAIKESSVYYHFKNKRAIFDELLLRFEAVASGLMQQLDEAILQPCAINEMSGEAVSKTFFEDYLMDDFCNSFMRLLHIEQSHDVEIQQVYDKWIFREPLRFQSKVFSALFNLKMEQAADSEYLALKYYAPIFFFFQRYLLGGELTEQKKEVFRVNVNYHIMNFFKENGGF